MFETRQIDPPAVPNAPCKDVCPAKSAYATAYPRHSLRIVAASLWLGAALLSGSTLNEAVAEPAKATLPPPIPQTSPIKVLWSKEYEPADMEGWKKKYPEDPNWPPSNLHLEPLRFVVAKDGLLVAMGLLRGDYINNYLAKFDANGELVWEKSYGPGMMRHLIELSDRYTFFIGDTPGAGRVIEVGKDGELLQERIVVDELFYSGKLLSRNNGLTLIVPPNSYCNFDLRRCRGWKVSYRFDDRPTGLKRLVSEEKIPFAELPVPDTFEKSKSPPYAVITDKFLKLPDGWLVLMRFENLLDTKHPGIISLIAEFDGQGKLRWSETYRGPGKTSYLTNIVATSDGYLATGYARKKWNFAEEDPRPWIVNLDKSGRKRFERVLPFAGRIDYLHKTSRGYLVTVVRHGPKPMSIEDDTVNFALMAERGDFLWEVKWPVPSRGILTEAIDGYYLVGEVRGQSPTITKITVTKIRLVQ